MTWGGFRLCVQSCVFGTLEVVDKDTKAQLGGFEVEEGGWREGNRK